MPDRRFHAMGTVVRVVSDADPGVELPPLVAEIARRLSRFDPTSELCALNDDPRAAVTATPLLRGAVAAALQAAVLTDGLVDPTVLPALCRAGYGQSRAMDPVAPLERALRNAPPRRVARSDPAARWRAVEVDDAAGVIRRPPGLGLDLGGSAKGWAADLLGARLEHQGRFALDFGGDLRVAAPGGAPWDVHVRHPLTGGVAHTLHLRAGGVATSGIDARLWRRPDGSFAHHLIDPSTGAPAWTGLLTVTALGPTALEAESLAKAALLSGPVAGRRLLRAYHGGVLVHDDGVVEPVRRRLRAASRRRAPRVRRRPSSLP